MKRPGSGSSEGGGLLAGLAASSGSNSSGPAVLKPLAPPPSYSPGQVSDYLALINNAQSIACSSGDTEVILR